MHSYDLNVSDHPSVDLPTFPEASSIPTALPEILRYWRLRIQLQHERCLNQLVWRLNEYVTTYLEAESEAWDGGSYQEALFQQLVSEISQGLMGAVVAIAVPIAGETTLTTQFVIRHLAPEPTQSLQNFWNLGSQSLRLQRDETLMQDDLQSLQVEVPERVWQIRDGQDLLGWLLIQSTTSPHQHHQLSGVLQSLNAQLVDRAVRHCVGTLRQLKLVQARRQQQQELITRNQELVQANRLKSEFLANTSHEIRTPLSSILGFTHLLREQGYGATNLRHQEYLKIILTSGQHLLALINDILDLSKIEANQLTLQWEAVDVRSLCQMALTLVREKAADKGLGLHQEISSDVTTLVADSLRLKQMLFNLLSNALKFTVQGAIGLNVTQSADTIRFTVWDTGVGISLEQQSLLFRPYSQLANAATNSVEGTGLGLALTQKLAELHGGYIEVGSSPNQGSRFTIVLPLAPASSASPKLTSHSSQTAASETPPPASPTTNNQQRTTLSKTPSALRPPRSPFRFSRRHICIQPTGSLSDRLVPPNCARSNHLMLVEDNPHNAKLLLTYLSKLGYELTWAQTGPEMWRALERCLPALILMDIHLPSVDGLTLIQQLQTSDRYRQIPVIAQTAMAMTGDRETCLEAGAVGYVSKPIDLTQLARLIEQHTVKT